MRKKKKKVKDNAKYNDHHIKVCKACGGKEIIPQHIIDEKEGFLIWLQCKQCEITTHSFQTYLDSVKEWNIVN